MSASTAHTIVALLITATLAACGDNPSAPPDPASPSLAVRTSQENVREEFLLTDVDNPCTPQIESVDLAGIIHGQGSQWDNDHFKSHYDVNLMGVDANGVRYQGSSTGNGKGEFLGSETEDVVISTVVSSQGAAPNFVSKIVLHHHKDGTSTVDRSGEECRG